MVVLSERTCRAPHRECVITREIVEANDTLLSLLEKAGEKRGEPPSL